MTGTEPPVVIARRKAAAQTQRRADAAVRSLVKRKAPVTFAAVAAEARVSAGYLHRHPTLAPRIRQLRNATRLNPLAAVGSTESAEPSVLDALREHLRRTEALHDQKVRALRDENSTLRADLEAALGEVLTLRRATPQVSPKMDR